MIDIENAQREQKEALPLGQQFWSLDASELLRRLGSSTTGLSLAEAKRRMPSTVDHKQNRLLADIQLFLDQFKNSIVLLLIGAAVLSLTLHETTDALIILSIVLISGTLGFLQEHTAADAMSKLLALVTTKVLVIRGGQQLSVPTKEIVPGDVIVLTAGATIPADAVLLESKDLFIDESALTGECFPVEKHVSIVPAENATISARTNCVFEGTHVISGQAKSIVVHTGKDTEFGAISSRLRTKPTESEFERGIHAFGYFLMEITMVLVVAIFAFNVFFHRPVLQSFMFSLALAVGLTPQLLPAIISINLAAGARRMAAQKVIVKRLSAIENFGAMNVLCSDKTGTLTEGSIVLVCATDASGKETESVLRYACLNSLFESGFANPIDEALRNHPLAAKLEGYEKVDEIPYDFIRKRLSVMVRAPGADPAPIVITKGALASVLKVCSHFVSSSGETLRLDDDTQRLIDVQMRKYSAQGCRVLGVCIKKFSRPGALDYIL